MEPRLQVVTSGNPATIHGSGSGSIPAGETVTAGGSEVLSRINCCQILPGRQSTDDQCISQADGMSRVPPFSGAVNAGINRYRSQTSTALFHNIVLSCSPVSDMCEDCRNGDGPTSAPFCSTCNSL